MYEPKAASKGDRRRVVENAAHLRKVQLLIGVSAVTYLVVRLVVRKESTSWLHWGGLALTAGSQALGFWGIHQALAPAYSSSGELIYGGGDLRTGGVVSYFHDIIYVAAFVQLASCISDWFWLVTLAVPLYALYALMVHVVLPLWNRPKVPAGMVESDADRRRREKRDRQASRTAKFTRR